MTPKRETSSVLVVSWFVNRAITLAPLFTRKARTQKTTGKIAVVQRDFSEGPFGRTFGSP